MEILTLTVVDVTIPRKTKSISPPRTSRVRRVRFAAAEVVEYVPDREELTADEKDGIWWSPLATKEIHRSAKKLGKEAVRNKWMVEGYEQAHQTARQMASSIRDEKWLLSKLENIQVDEPLLDWCKYGHSRRGLERRSSKSNDLARSDAARKSQRAVLHLAKEEADEESIRRAYERASRSSKIFARFMGEADALALTKSREWSAKRRNSDSSSIVVPTDGSCDSSEQPQT
jgi:hypothetical protein